jgi:murein DD-endopeptidase MepM/ murein hydrolase activator NlpD
MIVSSQPGGKTRTIRIHGRHVRAILGGLGMLFVGLIGWSFLDARQVSASADQLAEVQRLVLTLNDSLHAAQVRSDSALKVAAVAMAKKPAAPRSATLVERVANRTRHDEAGLSAPAPGVVLPVIGEITSRFTRSRLHPLLNVFRPHLGVDLSAPRGTNNTAPAAGKVTYVGRTFGDGLMVSLDHGGGVVTRYAHCQKALVKVGDEVVAGSVIATVGSSGLATGPHVHFEVVVNGKPVDPLAYLVSAHDSTAGDRISGGGGPDQPQH